MTTDILTLIRVAGEEKARQYLAMTQEPGDVPGSVSVGLHALRGGDVLGVVDVLDGRWCGVTPRITQRAAHHRRDTGTRWRGTPHGYDL